MKNETDDNPNCRARLFMEELKKTGVSEAFLTAAANSIEEAFRSVPEEALPGVLRAIEETTKRQAETEQALQRAADCLETLEAAETRLYTQLHQMSESLEGAKSTLTAASILLYSTVSGKGDPIAES